MEPYLAVPLVLVALLVAASGVAAVTRGWVPPVARRHVRTPKSYGWGQLVMAFALCWQPAFGLLSGESEARPSITLIGGVILLAGMAVMMVGQFSGCDREGGGTR